MDEIPNERVLELARRHSDEPLVSIYMPTHRAGKETRQDPIRLKNLLSEAAAQLAEHGWRERETDRRLAEAGALLSDGEFWKHQLDSLAVFIAAEGTETFRLALPYPELCLVADHFHLKPLLPLALQDDRFHLLALSQGKVRLFAVGRAAIEELDLGPIPASLEDALGTETDEQSLQFHSHPATRPITGGRGEAIFHGHGGGDDDREVELRQFLEAVDQGLKERLGDGRRPLLIAAVEQVAGNFRKTSRQPGLLPDFLEGNHDRTEPHVLQARAWELVAPHLSGERERDEARFREMVGTGLASEDLDQIAAAALAARVETLFVALDRQLWGRLDEAGRPQIHHRREAGDGDLLDRLASICLLAGARVHALPAAELPTERQAAAIFRY